LVKRRRKKLAYRLKIEEVKDIEYLFAEERGVPKYRALIERIFAYLETHDVKGVKIKFPNARKAETAAGKCRMHLYPDRGEKLKITRRGREVYFLREDV